MTRTRILALPIALLAAGSIWLSGQTPPPAPDLTGTWSGETILSRGPDMFTLVLAKQGGSYSGKISDAAGLVKEAPLMDVKYANGGLTFSFTASLPNRDLRIDGALTLESGRLVGSWTAETGDTGPFNFQRKT